MQLGYETTGNGPLVVMVHGLGGTSNTFQPQTLALSGRYTICRPDLPGAGRSWNLPAAPLHTVAEAIVGLADRLQAAQFHLVGHSLGTVICQILCLAQPSRIKSLTLMGPLAEATPAARGALTDRASKARQDGLDWFIDGYIANSLAKNTVATKPAVLAFLRESLARQNPTQYAGFCEALAQHQAVDLAKIAAPTLLITGDEDKVGTVPSVTAMKTAIANAQMLVLKECGHWLTVESPDEVNRALGAHLDASPPTA